MEAGKANPIREMIRLLNPYKVALLGVLGCSIILSCLEMALPMVVGYVIDHVFKADAADAAQTAARFRLLWVVLLIILVIYLLRNLIYYVTKPATIVVGEKAAFDLRQRLISHLHTLSVDFYQRNNPGKISARVMQDVQSVKLFIQDELAQVMLNGLKVVVTATIMLCLEWWLALVTFAVIPFHVLVYYLFRRPISTYAREAKEHSADVSGDLVAQFDAGGAATVKAAATQLLEQEKLRLSLQKGMDAQIKQSRYYTLQKIAADLLVGVGMIILFGVGGYAVILGRLEPGQFIAFFLYVRMLYPLSLELVSQAGKFTRTATSVERVAEIIQIPPGVPEKGSAIPAEITHGKIEFHGVSFSYENGENILDNVSVTLGPSEHVLVTGPSGSGKSTFVNLIARFYDPREGQILIDGVDVRDFTLDSLRRQIGFVFQDCFLFNDTVMSNIRYAWPRATDEQVMEAARRSYADDFVERLPNGYMTVIGEGGIKLSSGQERRLMIARAILKNPRILILDEPLISLDPEARRRSIEGLGTLIRNRTVLTITHYPSELPYADKQAYISDGKITIRDLSGRVIRSG